MPLRPKRTVNFLPTVLPSLGEMMYALAPLGDLRFSSLSAATADVSRPPKTIAERKIRSVITKRILPRVGSTGKLNRNHVSRLTPKVMARFIGGPRHAVATLPTPLS